jgi:hypothetical protein
MDEREITAARAHRPRMVRSGDVHEQIHGGGVAGRFNTWLAVRVTRTVGTMWVAYAFAALALVSLPAALATHETIVIVSWIAQTFLQLVLLPIILVGQNVIQAANDARAEADHETLTAVHRLTVAVHTINEHQTEILQELRKTAR